MSDEQLYVCPLAPCTQNPNCSHGKPHEHRDGCNVTGDVCAVCVPVEKPNKGVAVINQAKSIATSIHTHIKPYEKYIGLVALAVVIDHFLLDGKFAHKFKELAEVVVTKIQDGLGRLTERLSGEWFTDTGDSKEDN